MTIEINAFTFETIIGVLEHERNSKQPVVIDVAIDYPYEKDYINYAEVADLIKDTIIKNEFYLLEDALRSLFTILPTYYPRMTRLFIKIAKPSAVDSCIVSLSDTRSF